MGASIITGYTGTRHITPAMDAAVYRSAFGQGNCILSDGNQLEGSMPSINQFTVLDGLVSMQGHQVQVTQETLSVDTCANGYSRIDLVAMRYTHNNSTLIDDAELIVIKGTAVADPNTPSVPDYNTGDIDSGATVVDMPLYQINLSGSTVTFELVADVVADNLGTLADKTTGLFSTTSVTSEVLTIASMANLADQSITASNPGFYPVGIVGMQINYTQGQVSARNVYQYYISSASSGSATVSFSVRNLDSAQTRGSVQFWILWVRADTI